jgi:hypothetical protein
MQTHSTAYRVTSLIVPRNDDGRPLAEAPVGDQLGQRGTEAASSARSPMFGTDAARLSAAAPAGTG